MSGCYTLTHVLNEVLAEKARVLSVSRGTTAGAKVEIYSESWQSLNSWIESRLCKRKGASVPMLGAFTWELKYGGDGSAYSRPIFIMSDSFIKEHRIRRQRVHVQPSLVPPEEINYSKLAIKFSKSLTKDMIFTGTRDIIKKIGDFVDRSYEFEIEFPFGTLKSKERQVRFEFNQGRLAAILPENLRVGTMPQQPITYDAMSMSESEGGINSSSSISSSNQEAESARGKGKQRTTLGLASRPSSSSSSAPFQYPPAPSSASGSAFTSQSLEEPRSSSAPALPRQVPKLSLPSVQSLQQQPPPLQSQSQSQSQSQQDDQSGSTVSFAVAAETNSDAADYVLSPSPTTSSPSPSHGSPQQPSAYINTAVMGSSMQQQQQQQALQTASQALSMAASVPLTHSGYLERFTDNPERPISPGLQAVLMALEEHAELGAATKAELRARAVQRCEEDAYLRSLEKVESEAMFEEKTAAVAKEMQDQFELSLTNKLSGIEGQKKGFKKMLDAQLIESEHRRKVEAQRIREGKAAFFLPDSAGCSTNPPGALTGGPNYKIIKQNLYNDLTFQMRSKAERTRQQKQADLEEEQDYLDHVAMELDLQHIAERVTHLEKQKQLLASWERDAHIRNLRKLQVAGANAVKDYIYVNLPEAAEAAATKAVGKYSIGYDFRKGAGTNMSSTYSDL